MLLYKTDLIPCVARARVCCGIKHTTKYPCTWCDDIKLNYILNFEVRKYGP